jgi:hypothetical protein
MAQLFLPTGPPLPAFDTKCPVHPKRPGNIHNGGTGVQPRDGLAALMPE